MKSLPIDYKEYKGLYTIREDGAVFSIRKNKLLKPSVRKPYGYIAYFLTPIKGSGKWFYEHILSSHHFNGPCPKGKERHHKDHNRQNNHYTNIKYVTHSQNILLSFKENGRYSFWKGKNKPPPSLQTRLLMADAKHKEVIVTDIDTGLEMNFNSIKDLIKHFGLYRRKFNRIMNNGGEFENWKIKYK